MSIAGLRGTGDWGTDERPKNFRETILFLSPNGDAPLTGLMSKMSKSSTDDPEFSWWEEQLDIVRLQLNDGTDMTDSDTTFVVDNGDARDLRIGDLLLVEKSGANQTTSYDNEIVEVTAVTNATTFTATRGAAGSTAAAIVDDTWFTLIGNAFEEGSSSPESTSRNPTKFYNYAQIFKTAYEFTETAKVTKARTGPIKKMDKKRRMFDHSRALEYSWIFGKRNETTGSGGKPKRYTGGLMYFMAAKSPTRIKVVSSAYTHMRGLLDDLYEVFDYTGDGSTGGDQRLVICGNGVLNSLSKLADASGDVNFSEVARFYGMNLRKFESPQGTFMFRSHPLFNRHSVYTNTMMVLDPPGLRYRPLRDTKAQENIQANDEDAEKGQWLTEAGCEFNHLETMKVITNLSVTIA